MKAMQRFRWRMDRTSARRVGALLGCFALLLGFIGVALPPQPTTAATARPQARATVAQLATAAQSGPSCLPVDLVFVVDTTGSMGGSISSVKSEATNIINTLAAQGNGFQAGVVSYNDYDDRTSNDASVLQGLTNNQAAIVSAINSLSANGGGDTPEDVVAGLQAALGLAWRRESSKAIILMGDAPDHPGANIQGVINSARSIPDNGVQIFAVLVGGDSSAQAQFQQLASGTRGQLLSIGGGSAAAAVLQAIDRATSCDRRSSTPPPPAPRRPPDPQDVNGGINTLEITYTDQSAGLDTPCRFQSDVPNGRLSVDVPIKRYVGPTNAQGFLLPEAQTKLINQNVIARYARLFVSAFDIDAANGEVDTIFINGQRLIAHDGTGRQARLNGGDNAWLTNSFDVPIELLKFPTSKGDFAAGGSPTPAINRIEFAINVADRPNRWCLSIDWVALQFDAMAPLALIHGTNANQDAWDRFTVQDLERQVPPNGAFPRESARTYLERELIPFEWRINLPEPNGYIRDNGDDVRNAAVRVAASYGTNKVNLVGHSKGGLDSRWYLSPLSGLYNPDQTRVLTFHSVSTPHHGTVLADFSVLRRRYPGVALASAGGDLDALAYFTNDWIVADIARGGPQFPALDDLRPRGAEAFNRQVGPPPADVRFFSYGADADVRDVPLTLIDNNEATPQFADIPFNIRGFAASVYYRLLRDRATIRVRIIRNLPPNGDSYQLETVPNRPPQPNDLIVNVGSATLGSEPHANVDGNHRNAKDNFMLRRILDNINCAFPIGPQRPLAPCR